MADDIIERAKAVLEGVTEGPWEVIGGGEYVTGVGILVAPDDGGVTSADAEFIAASRTLVPELIMEIEILRGRAKDAFNAGWDARGYSEGLQ